MQCNVSGVLFFKKIAFGHCLGMMYQKMRMIVEICSSDKKGLARYNVSGRFLRYSSKTACSSGETNITESVEKRKETSERPTR